MQGCDLEKDLGKLGALLSLQFPPGGRVGSLHVHHTISLVGELIDRLSSRHPLFSVLVPETRMSEG